MARLKQLTRISHRRGENQGKSTKFGERSFLRFFMALGYRMTEGRTRTVPTCSHPVMPLMLLPVPACSPHLLGFVLLFMFTLCHILPVTSPRLYMRNRRGRRGGVEVVLQVCRYTSVTKGRILHYRSQVGDRNWQNNDLGFSNIWISPPNCILPFITVSQYACYVKGGLIQTAHTVL
jgi:hypothetical protein